MVSLEKLNPMMPEACTVLQVTRDTADTYTLSVKAPERDGDSSYQPGQFSMLWAFGVGEVPISISGDPADAGRLTYTIRDVGATTHAIVTRRAGDGIGVRGPFGVGWPMEAASGRDVIVIAGGIGLAPLRPAIYRVLGNRKEYGRLVILYGARTPMDLLYRRELTAWGRHPDTQVLVTVDTGGHGWRGQVGVVTTLFQHARLQPSRSIAMVCGPEIMMHVTARELESQGLSREDVYLSVERNMECAVGFCGHCQYGPHFICKDGPVFGYERIRPLMEKHEI